MCFLVVRGNCLSLFIALWWLHNPLMGTDQSLIVLYTGQDKMLLLLLLLLFSINVGSMHSTGWRVGRGSYGGMGEGQSGTPAVIGWTNKCKVEHNQLLDKCKVEHN